MHLLLPWVHLKKWTLNESNGLSTHNRDSLLLENGKTLDPIPRDPIDQTMNCFTCCNKFGWHDSY